MKKLTSHRKILELWKPLEKNSNISYFLILALDIQEELRKSVKRISISYYKVYRWHERNNVPIEYHCALIAAAKKRGFAGVNEQVLTAIKARELAA